MANIIVTPPPPTSVTVQVNDNKKAKFIEVVSDNGIEYVSFGVFEFGLPENPPVNQLSVIL